MTIAELRQNLAKYPDEMEIVVLVDYGTGYLLHPITRTLNTSEFRDDQTDKAVIRLLEMVESPTKKKE